MRIGIDARFVGPQGTGLGKYTEKLIENLTSIDRKNEYIIFLRQGNWSHLKLNQENFKKALADVAWYSIDEQIKMPSLYMAQNLDLLHVPHFNVPLMYRKPFVVTIHDLIHHKFSQESATTKNPLIFKIKRFAYKKIIKNAIFKSEKIITPSEYVKREIIGTFPAPTSKIVVTYEAAEEEFFADEPSKIKNKKPTLLYVGNTYPHKNISKLLDAINILKLKIMNLKLIIVCPRDIFFKRLQEEINEKGLTQNVDIYSYQKPAALKKIFKKATAYVFPSLEEGFGIPGLNAMASALPVICSNIPTLKEIYGDAAVYFNPNDPQDIAAKVQRVLRSAKIRQDLIKKGQEQVIKYTWAKMAKQTLKVYENCTVTR